MIAKRCLGIYFAALCASHAIAQTAPLSAAMVKVMAVAKDAGLSGEIALSDENGAVLDQTLGLADREARRPHRPGARWLWASVTKQVTAVLTMQQVEAGKLSLDGTVRSYLPAFAGVNGDRITLRLLLQHTSGLPNPDDSAQEADSLPAFYNTTGSQAAETESALGFCAGKPKAEPGAGFAYNNCDYLVLGAILERVTGKSYAALVDERIARPLGLRSLQLAPEGALGGGGVAVGYIENGKRYPPVNVATFGAAGALTGTAQDLLVFDRALVAGKLLKPDSLATLWSGDPKLGYEAFGVWSFSAQLRGCPSPVALIERRGEVGGIQVRNVIAPELGRAIAVFTNDDTFVFGEIWQGKGFSYDLLSAGFCTPVKA